MDILLNQIKRTWMPLFSLLGLFLFSSCVNEEHADEKGLSVFLTWQDPVDKETEYVSVLIPQECIQKLSVTIDGKDYVYDNVTPFSFESGKPLSSICVWAVRRLHSMT